MTPTLVRCAVIGSIVLGAAGSVHAAGKRFTTPVLSNATNEVFVCSVLNVDKKPVTVDVKLLARNGSTLTLAVSDCDVPIQPGTGCRVVGPATSGSGYCDVVSSGTKVRVELSVLDNTNPNHVVVAVPGTLK